MSARKFCTKTATIKRRNDVGGYDTIATDIAVTPPWPVDTDNLQRAELNTPRSLHECYHVPTAGASIPAARDGDRLIHEGTEYPIIHAGIWEHSRVPTLHMRVDKAWGT